MEHKFNIKNVYDLSAFSGQYNGKEAWTRTPVDHELECIYGDAVVATNYIVSWY